LFCYTGSFSVYAASAGASLVTSVDLSKTYLQWAADNFVINRLKNDVAYQFVHADVLQHLKTIPPDSYDIVVMDPPTFSNSKRMEDFLDIQRDHVDLINDALKVLSLMESFILVLISPSLSSMKKDKLKQNQRYHQSHHTF